MNSPDAPIEPADASWRLRLHASEADAHAARAEARCLARELALVRRLLRFSGRSADAPPPAAPPGEAILLTAPVLYHLDACENRGTHLAISGWAFRPAAGWDARDTAITLRFRHGATVYQAAAIAVPRPDVAAHYAAQPPAETGGATGLEGAGFACEVRSLPAGIDFEIELRLVCGDGVCEQPTGTLLRF